MAKQKVPTTATVFGALNLVFSILGICSAPVMVGLMLFQMENKNGPVAEVWGDIPGYQTATFIGVGLSLVATVPLLISGIGLLKGQPWGRSTALVYCALQFVLIFVSTGINYVMMIQPLTEKFQQKGGPMADAAIMGAWGGMAFGVCGGMIYPIILGIFMLRLKLGPQATSMNRSIDDYENVE